MALKGRLIGQYSGQILPPAEKFFLGGPEYNRGFYSGEVTGDSAFVWQAELQLNTTYDVTLFDRTFNLAAQFYGSTTAARPGRTSRRGWRRCIRGCLRWGSGCG